MDKEYMRTYYRRFYENPCDFVISESIEFKEKRDLRYKLEDELTEMFFEILVIFITSITI